MLNDRTIVISGFTRGGTNILWNILQSHPKICSAGHETGRLFRKDEPFRFGYYLALFHRTGLMEIPLIRRVGDYKLHQLKMQNLHHDENRFRNEHDVYSRKEVSDSAICFKSVDNDIFHTDLLLRIYPDLCFIALTRNGYALAEGQIRRGRTVEEVANLYKTIAEKMAYYSDTVSNFRMVKFEDILQSPFEAADDLFKFAGVSPTRLEKLRLKSKKIVSGSGDHKAAFGVEHNKYWFDRIEIGGVLDRSVNLKQIDQLPEKTIEKFTHLAGDALDYFGYERL